MRRRDHLGGASSRPVHKSAPATENWGWDPENRWQDEGLGLAIGDYTGPRMTAVSGDTSKSNEVAADEASERMFSTSLFVSGVRCLLAYIVFPWLLPALGLASGVAPAIGIAISLIAIGFNVYSIRRFRSSQHPWRKQVIGLNVVIIVLLSVMLVVDVTQLT